MRIRGRLAMLAVTLVITACRPARPDVRGAGRAPHAARFLALGVDRKPADLVRHPPAVQVELFLLDRRCRHPYHPGLIDAMTKDPATRVAVLVAALEHRRSLPADDPLRMDLTTLIHPLHLLDTRVPGSSTPSSSTRP